jgi:hypothetical protein
VLGIGAGLIELPNLVRFEPGPRTQGRVETLAAVVALAGEPGIPELEAFELTYEFAYVPDVHRGVFDVVLHRVRAHLGSHAELVRERGRLRLLPAVPLLLPDPRCSPHTTDRVLQLLAERGRAGAKDAASASGVSLRTAQGALQELVNQGACNVEKRGRNVVYVVEDSVFSEPSLRLTLEHF